MPVHARTTDAAPVTEPVGDLVAHALGDDTSPAAADRLAGSIRSYGYRWT